jgi:hypothetical protein
MPDPMRRWLGQQSKDFYAVGFDALVKRWDKWINVGEYVEKNVFVPQVRIIMFYILYPFVAYLLTLPRKFLYILSRVPVFHITFRIPRHTGNFLPDCTALHPGTY